MTKSLRARPITGTIGLVCLMLLVMASSSTAQTSKQRALVLSGGGPVGEAWESGVLVGLKESGVDLSDADLILGTSAGAVVGGRLASRMPQKDFIDAALAPADAPPPGAPPAPKPSGPPPDLSFLGAKLDAMTSDDAHNQPLRAAIGRWAMQAHPVVDEAGFVASYQRRFPAQWPSRAFECVSIDAGDGSIKVWKESSNEPTALAVAASCALPGVFAPVAINGHRYMDGGVRSVSNADLASGCRTALVLAPTMGLNDPLAKSFTRALPMELAKLRAGGCQVELIAPDAASIKAFGPSVGNERGRSPAFDAGRVEGQNLAREIGELWRR